MSRIYKYPLSIADEQQITIPTVHKILCVQVQRGVPCLWAEVDTGSTLHQMRISIFGTGHKLPDEPGRYVGTIQMSEGSLVWHVYVRAGA